MDEFAADGLRGTISGEGIPVVLLHGLTATRRYVVMGSRALERSGHRVLNYDARGHGQSSPGKYEYADLARDIEAVMDAAGFDAAVLAGASMGAHTIVRFALEHPERVAAAALITPAHDPDADLSDRIAHYDALSDGLRSGGVDGFLAAYGDPPVPEKWLDTVRTILCQRLSAHDHPEAVADALRVVPRSPPFSAWGHLTELDMPAVVVASRDEVDPEHPYALGVRYAELMPNARLLSEEPGSSPLAWQGGQLSKVIAELAASAAA
jgi:pimeloyl-ACP methyl ester carboxylesterase